MAGEPHGQRSMAAICSKYLVRHFEESEDELPGSTAPVLCSGTFRFRCVLWIRPITTLDVLHVAALYVPNLYSVLLP